MVVERPRDDAHGVGRSATEASQRVRLEDAMLAAVGEHGFSGATLADLTARARVSRKTLYELYGTKEACFAVVLEGLYADLLAGTLAAFEGDAPWPDRLAAALRVLLTTLQDDRRVARLCFVEAPTAGPESARARRTAVARLAALFRPDPPGENAAIEDLAARMMAAGLADVVHVRLTTDPAADLRDLLPAVLHPVLAMHLGPEDGRATAEWLLVDRGPAADRVSADGGGTADRVSADGRRPADGPPADGGPA
jgi:AcrR family transcriptional regulator